MSSFAGIETALRALRARQLQMETATHNVANAETPGYHRQEVDLVASPPYPAPGFGYAGPGQIGTGVTVSGLRRVADSFLAHRLRLELAQQGASDVRQDTTARIETVFDELSDHGVSTLLGRFWNAWQEVANAPTDPGIRMNLVTQAQTFAESVQRTARQLQDLRRDLDEQVRIQVEQLNQLAGEVAGLNRQIAVSEGTGLRANDLRDRRDALLGELARLARVGIAELPNGNVRVVLAGVPLVEGEQVTPVSTQRNPTGWLDVVGPGGVVLQPSGGSLAVNDVHAGTNPPTNVYDLVTPGTPVQRDFFVGTGAADLAVNPALLSNPSLVAASRTANGPGDGSNALAVAALREDATAGGAPAGAPTIDGEYQALVAAIGHAARSAKDAAESQDVLVEHLTRRDAELAGVSLDEEAARLVAYQRAYQAAARALTAFDEMLERLINGTGRVGR